MRPVVDNREQLDGGTNKPSAVVDRYRDVISSLKGSEKRRPTSQPVRRSLSPPPTSTFAAGDEWLEEDLIPSKRKRLSKPRLSLTQKRIDSKPKRPRLSSFSDDEPAVPDPEPMSTPSEISQPKQTIEEPTEPGSTLRFIIEIEGKKFKVPIDRRLKVENLSEKVIDRYVKSFGRRPTIHLEDSDQCELDGGDALVDVFGNVSGDIKLTVKVVGWNLKPIGDSYLEICDQMNILKLDQVHDAVNAYQTTGIVNLGFSELRGVDQTVALLKTLKFRPNLTEVNLAGIKLGSFEESWIAELAATLCSTPTLAKLNLSNNLLGPNHIEKLEESFKLSEPSSLSVTDLDLSYNSFSGQNPATFMTLLRRMAKLTNLNLSCCDLAENFFDRNLQLWTDIFSKLIAIDVSFNTELEVQGVRDLLVSCDPGTLRHLDVSGCTSVEGLSEVLWDFANRGNPDIALETLKLARNVNASFHQDLIGSLYHLTNLKVLDLSFCKINLAFIEMLFSEFFAQSSNVEEVLLRTQSRLETRRTNFFCDNLTRIVERGHLKTLSFTHDPNNVEFFSQIRKIWETAHERRVKTVTNHTSWTITTALL